MKGKFIFMAEGVLGFVIGSGMYDRFIGLVFAFFAGALGYLGKIAVEKLQHWYELKQHGKD